MEQTYEERKGANERIIFAVQWESTRDTYCPIEKTSRLKASVSNWDKDLTSWRSTTKWRDTNVYNGDMTGEYHSRIVINMWNLKKHKNRVRFRFVIGNFMMIPIVINNLQWIIWWSNELNIIGIASRVACRKASLWGPRRQRNFQRAREFNIRISSQMQCSLTRWDESSKTILWVQ